MGQDKIIIQRIASNLSKPGKSKLDDPYVKKVIFGLLLCLLPYPIIIQIIIFWHAPLTPGVLLIKGMQLFGVIGYLLILSAYLHKFYIQRQKADQ